MTDDEAREGATNSRSISFQVEGELRVFIGSEDDDIEGKARADAEKAIRAGHVVTWSDGTREWIHVSQDWEWDRTAATYFPHFHDDGNRCRHSRVRIHVAPDGTRTETKLRPVWRIYS